MLNQHILRENRDAMSDEMIEALGRFVTEVGDVEYVMFETPLPRKTQMRCTELFTTRRSGPR